MMKNEETRSLRKKGYRVLELYYDSYSDKKRDELYQQIRDNLNDTNFAKKVLR